MSDPLRCYQHTSHIILCFHFCWHSLMWALSCKWSCEQSEQGFLPFMLYLLVWGSWVLMIVLCEIMIFISVRATWMKRIEPTRITASARGLITTLHDSSSFLIYCDWPVLLYLVSECSLPCMEPLFTVSHWKSACPSK